jgi:hypothetical protein
MSVRSQSGSLIIVHGRVHLKHAAVRKSRRTGRIEALQEFESRMTLSAIGSTRVPTWLHVSPSWFAGPPEPE